MTTQENFYNPRVVFDGKRIRKAVVRRTVDYHSTIIRWLEERVWQKHQHELTLLEPDENFLVNMLPPWAYSRTPANALATKFVHTSTNKVRCPVNCVRWTSEGRRLITGSSSGEFTLWNGLTFNFETILQAHDTAVRCMIWSHSDNYMVSADHSGYIKYWQPNMSNLKIFQGHKDPIRGLTFAPTDSKLASCSDDGSIKIWDFNLGQEETTLTGHGWDVRCVEWHPQKALLVSGSKDNLIKLWDPKSGKNIATIHGHKNSISSLQWNRNGNWLASCSRDQLVKLFDLRNLKEFQVFRGHKKEVTSLAWHPIHESLLVSGGSDGSIYFWHVNSNEEVASIQTAHDSNIWTMSWHPVGHILVSGSNDHTTKFWTRQRPGDHMRDRYNLGLPLGMTPEMAAEFENEDMESYIPGLNLSGGGHYDHQKQHYHQQQQQQMPFITPSQKYGGYSPHGGSIPPPSKWNPPMFSQR